MKKAAIVLVALQLGGCLSDADTASNRSVLPPASQPSRTGKDDDTGVTPHQLCESTMEGNEPRTVCY